MSIFKKMVELQHSLNIQTTGKDYLYKIFSVDFTKRDNIEKFTRQNLSKSEMNKYIKQSLEDSIFEFNIDVNENDKILSLVTCTRMFGHYNDIEFRVDARLVRDGELKFNYDVEKSDNYKKVEDIMESGDNDEKA